MAARLAFCVASVAAAHTVAKPTPGLPTSFCTGHGKHLEEKLQVLPKRQRLDVASSPGARDDSAAGRISVLAVTVSHSGQVRHPSQLYNTFLVRVLAAFAETHAWLINLLSGSNWLSALAAEAERWVDRLWSTTGELSAAAQGMSNSTSNASSGIGSNGTVDASNGTVAATASSAPSCLHHRHRASFWAYSCPPQHAQNNKERHLLSHQ